MKRPGWNLSRDRITDGAAGKRWQQQGPREGATARECGRLGGRARNPAKGRVVSPQTRQEVVLRWLAGEATQGELAAEYGVARSSVQRWARESDDCGIA